MKFVKTEDLKIGMRLAKPIYNNKGVLLYERNSKLTQQGIESVHNFKLIGLYVLEPAEPLPPMSEDDLEFEKFQMVAVYSVQDELESLRDHGKPVKMLNLADSIIRNYGRLDHKINFVQNLRSPEDFIYKHSLNVAILTAMIMNRLNARNEERNESVIAAITHDVGKLSLDPKLLVSEEIDDVQRGQMRYEESCGVTIVEKAFVASPNIKRIIAQAQKKLLAFEQGEDPDTGKMFLGAKALVVAEMYDRMTAINSAGEPQSEVAVLKLFFANSDYFDPKVVDALVKSINILSEGCCVELSNGEKALVIAPNRDDILRPMVLCFSTNTIVDLAQTMLYSELEIVDIMKTLDNRYVMGSADDMK